MYNNNEKSLGTKKLTLVFVLLFSSTSNNRYALNVG